MKTAIKTIAEHYGISAQLLKLAEECCELSLAAMAANLSYDTDGRVTKQEYEALVDELAEVTVMVSQVTYLTGCASDVEERMKYKLARQLDRMEGCVNDMP